MKRRETLAGIFRLSKGSRQWAYSFSGKLFLCNPPHPDYIGAKKEEKEMLTNLPVMYLECPDNVDIMDYIKESAEPNTHVYIVKAHSQFNFYLYHESSKMPPTVIYYDIGQHFYPPDVLTTTVEPNASVLSADDLLDECEDSKDSRLKLSPWPDEDTDLFIASEKISERDRYIMLLEDELKDRLSPNFVIDLVKAITT